MPSPTDFNVSPYFDDFTESKNFHKVLFRPAFAVQARELTQLQTILQNQMERVGDHLFKQGAMVIPGQLSIDTNYTAVKLTSKSASSLSTYLNTIVTGNSSGVIGKVVKVDVTDGTDPDTLYVKYSKTGTNNTSYVFTDGETITSDATGNPTAVVNTTATGSSASIKEGVYYINGFFVQVTDQTIILDKYTSTPSYRIGLSVTESFITPTDDVTLNDNATGSSNESAPGAHRFKISLTLAKKTLSSTEDSNFFEIGRVENGEIKTLVRSTDYSILEDTFARRTYDESGDYTLGNPDIDVREHLISGNNRGIYTSGEGGDEAKLAVGISPFKAYVRGYEVDKLSTTYVNVDKARDFDTQNNNKTRFNLKNFVNVDNVYGSPDVGFVSGELEAFKNINLYDTPTSVRGTEQSTSGNNVPQIGRAKSRGFETISSTETDDINATSSIYRHYLFDIEMFTHIKIIDATSFTTGEVLSGATSGAKGTVQGISTTNTASISGVTQANPGVVSATSHGFKDGDAVTITSVAGMTQLNNNTYYVKYINSGSFSLADSSGTDVDTSGFSAYSSSGSVAGGVVVLSNVQGTFQTGEIVTGATSSNSSTVKENVFGNKGVLKREFTAVKQIGMAGSPTYTADTRLDNTYGDNYQLTGNVSIANSDATLLGKGTFFTTELKVGDQITFTSNTNTTITKTVQRIVSQTELELTSVVGGGDVTTAAIVTRQRAKLQNPESNISIFKLPYETVKTLKTTQNSGQTDTNFNVRRNFTVTLSSNGDGTISAGTNEIFASLSTGDFNVSIMTIGAGTTGTVGDQLNLSGNNHEGDPIFVLGGSPTGKTLTLDFGADFQGHKIKILATVVRSVAISKTKTLNNGSTVQKTSQTEIESGVIGLGKADIYQLNAVYMSSGFGANATVSDTNITSRFDLDNGQRDNFYDIGRLRLKPGALKPTGRLLVNFDYFSHGSGDYFDVDSYSGVVSYENIPSYISDTTGQKFELRDSVDFRPRVDDATTINSGLQDRSFDGTGASTVDIPKFDSDITTDFEFYLNRIDKIFLTREGEVKVLKGASALTPIIPGNIEGHLHLATLTIPSYTLNTDEVIVDVQDNKRFTMRDIGRLEKRIQNVEYYTQLSLLEANAQSLQIQDADGFDRFKNGFIVDNFTGHNIGDVGNNDYKLSIDRVRGEARTPFNEDVIELEEIDDDGTAIVAADRTAANYQKTGDLITLPYTEEILIEQPFATKTENLNPFNVFNWIGTVELDPPVDEWKETRRAPDLIVNTEGTFDNLARQLGLTNSNTNRIPTGTEWNGWQDQWSGRPSSSTTRSGNQEITTTSTRVVQTRSGIRTDIVPQTVLRSFGDRVVSVNFVPFIRSREINFTAQGMRPNTRVYPYFDNIAISSYVLPDGGSLSDPLVTDNNGSISGTFQIPDPNTDSNPRWRTGKRIFRLTSSSTNTDVRTNTATSAEADYDAKGLLETQQEVITSTREARVVRQTVTQSRNITRTSRSVTNLPQGDGGGDGGGGDPLAQSFIIDEVDGAFVTSLDVYFQTKSNTIPVRAEIRNMVNGYPGSKVIPFSQKYLNPSQINTSSDASVATTFTFPSPVYLQEGVEYCFVLYSDSNDYLVYVSRLGERVIGSDRTVSKQPNIGVLFKSSNYRTWTPEQMEDIKFTFKRAKFDTTTSGVVSLANKALPTRTLDNNSIRTFNGSSLVRVFHPDHGLHSTNDNVTISGIASGTYNGISNSDINGTYTSISNITLDSYDITTSGTATATGDTGGTGITATQNRQYDVLQLQIGHLVHPDTSITTNIRTTTGKSVHGTETPFTRDSATDVKSAVLGDNIYFTEPKVVASSINETNEMSDDQSLLVNLTLTSSNEYLSPVIDTKRLSAFAISNRLNNPTVSFTDTFTGDGSSIGFTLSGTPTSVHLLSVKQNGLTLSPVDDYTVSGTTLTLDTAPPSGSKLVVKLTNTVDYEDETAVEGSSSAGSYITKPVNLVNPSTALDIRVAASVRSTSNIKMYFRLTGGEETRRIADIPFTPFNTDGSSDETVEPSTGAEVLDNDFRDYKFSVSDLPEFTSFQIKVVFTGTNSAVPARLKDFRGIALAI
jgi:hypothetical protein